MTKKLSLYLCIAVLVVLNTVNISCTKGSIPPKTTDTEEQTPASLKQFSFTASNKSSYGYWLYSPENPTNNMPLIVYLHGGSGRGNNLNLVINGSLPKFLHDGTVKDIPAYILIPQCPTGEMWERIAPSVIELIDRVTTEKRINKDKISLTGHSLGGSGTWRLGASYTSKFSCIAPLSGSVRQNTASSYVNIPIWAFVGSEDDIVDPDRTTDIVPIINDLGGNAQVKVYNGADHFKVPELVYKDDSVNLLDWMISNTK